MQRTDQNPLPWFGTIKDYVATAFIRIGCQEWWLPWLYLVCIIIAELVTSLVQPRLGMLMYLLILLGLTGGATDVPRPATRRFMLGLTLALPVRVLLLLLAHTELLHGVWYPVVALLFIIAIAAVVRQSGVSVRTIGLHVDHLRVQLLLAGAGLSLGAIEYMILRPQPLLPSLVTPATLAPVLALMLFVGFVEETVFRGLLPRLARPVLGPCTLLYIALLTAVLHIGYLSVADVIFAFESAVLFGFLAERSGSIMGVGMAHGVAYLVLFAGMPFLAQHSSGSTPMIMTAAIIAVSMVVTGALLARQVSVKPGRVGPAFSVDTRLRILRHLYGLTYGELAACTGIPVRELAAIEHGLEPIAPERLGLLRQLLGERTIATAQPTDRS